VIPGSKAAICILIENEAVPYDRRVWLEARALRKAGYSVSVICPKCGLSKRSQEAIDGVEIYKYWSWESEGVVRQIFEYAWSLLPQFVRSGGLGRCAAPLPNHRQRWLVEPDSTVGFTLRALPCTQSRGVS